jgi:microcystin-dependent protein
MSEPFLGEIRAFCGTFAPVGWAMCNGALLSIAQESALFALLGTTYGGDGVQTFGLPDLRGRAVINQGQGLGLSNYAMGEQVGVEAVTVTTTQMGGHSHTFAATTTAGTTPTPSQTVVLAATPAGFPIYDGVATAVSLAPNAVSIAGGSQPHDNRQPYLAITYIIATSGIFPSQS